jgi:fatty acid desaturase
MTWTIGPDNIDLKRFIFAQVLTFASYPLPDREASCGTFIIDLPIPGVVLYYLMLILGLGGMGGGSVLMNRSKPLTGYAGKALRPVTFLGVVLTAALLVSLAGWWVQAVLLLAVSLVTVFVTLTFVFFR